MQNENVDRRVQSGVNVHSGPLGGAHTLYRFQHQPKLSRMTPVRSISADTYKNTQQVAPTLSQPLSQSSSPRSAEDGDIPASLLGKSIEHRLKVKWK